MSEMSEMSLRLALLDLQLIDSDGLPVGRVDDLEVDLGPPDAAGATDPQVSWLLVGGPHLSGRLTRGRRQRDAGQSRGARIPSSLVTEWGAMAQLARPLQDLPLGRAEKWLAAHVVSRIPGADDEGL